MKAGAESTSEAMGEPPAERAVEWESAMEALQAGEGKVEETEERRGTVEEGTGERGEGRRLQYLSMWPNAQHLRQRTGSRQRSSL